MKLTISASRRWQRAYKAAIMVCDRIVAGVASGGPGAVLSTDVGANIEMSGCDESTSPSTYLFKTVEHRQA